MLFLPRLFFLAFQVCQWKEITFEEIYIKFNISTFDNLKNESNNYFKDTQFPKSASTKLSSSSKSSSNSSNILPTMLISTSFLTLLMEGGNFWSCPLLDMFNTSKLDNLENELSNSIKLWQLLMLVGRILRPSRLSKLSRKLVREHLDKFKSPQPTGGHPLAVEADGGVTHQSSLQSGISMLEPSDLKANGCQQKCQLMRKLICVITGKSSTISSYEMVPPGMYRYGLCTDLQAGRDLWKLQVTLVSLRIGERAAEHSVCAKHLSRGRVATWATLVMQVKVLQ